MRNNDISINAINKALKDCKENKDNAIMSMVFGDVIIISEHDMIGVVDSGHVDSLRGIGEFPVSSLSDCLRIILKKLSLIKDKSQLKFCPVELYKSLYGDKDIK